MKDEGRDQGNLLFETIKAMDGKLLNMKYHNLRAAESRRVLFGYRDELDLNKHDYDIPEQGQFRVKVIYGKKIEQVEIKQFIEFPVKILKILKADYISYEHKYLNRSQLDNLFNQKGKADDILIVKNGFVTDTSIANICFFDGKDWVTPDTPLLSGTYRRQLLDKKKIVEKTIRLQDINNYKKIAIINALRPMEVVEKLIGL
ncbi:MAG: aminotransferase class IV [Candidatus Margulisbacteria bacterium]|nr:aminotransferase class IV [Candidatus Margulisiibacteriota bacterium]